MRRLLLGLVAALAAAAIAPPAGAATFHPCPSKTGFDCMTVWVPLDRTGATPGRIPLRVERLRAARGPYRGVFIFLAGGPGQEGIFDTDGEYEQYVQGIAPGWDIVSVDQRGTGRSGVLRCEGLEEDVLPPPYGDDPFHDAAEAASLCASDLGAAAGHYATADTVADLEAVRQSLGVRRFALGGVSYGTVVAQAYAATFPQRVSRLVLDSVVDPESNDGFALDTLETVPRVLDGLCSRPVCKRITRNLPADVRTLDARLAQAPLTGTSVDRNGRAFAASFGGPLQPTALLDLIVSGDLEPIKRALLPGAVKAALAGDAAPLLRLVRPSPNDRFEPAELSIALFVATSCLDTRLPWATGASPADRLAALDAAAAAVPDARLGPFSRGVLARSDFMGTCLGWPYGPEPQAFTPLPQVPTLVINGLDDTRTTVAEARRVAARIPGSQVVIVPNQGHSVVGSARCADTAMRRFMTGRPVRKPCLRNGQRIAVAPLPPARLDAVPLAPGLTGVASRALQAVRQTLDDLDPAFALATEFTRRDGLILTGLRQGTAVLDVDGDFNLLVRLRGYTFVPGVELTGTVRFKEREVEANLRIAGDRRAAGRLVLDDRRYTGTLGGRRVDWTIP